MFNKTIYITTNKNYNKRGGAREDKGGGLKIRWLRPAWVRIPPAALLGP